MSVHIRIASRSCYQPPRNTRRADAATLPISSNSCYQPPRPPFPLEGMGARRSDGLALIDWPVVAVAAAFALLFVVGLTMTAWLLEFRSGFASAGGAQTSETSITPARVYEEQEEVLASVPASSRGFEPSPNPPGPFPEREGGEVFLPSPLRGGAGGEVNSKPNPPAPFPAREGGGTSAPANSRQTFGTSVEFVSRPALAARQARDDQKLLYVLHLSGNFENDRFT